MIAAAFAKPTRIDGTAHIRRSGIVFARNITNDVTDSFYVLLFWITRNSFIGVRILGSQCPPPSTRFFSAH
jgi:hypothetical protein